METIQMNDSYDNVTGITAQDNDWIQVQNVYPTPKGKLDSGACDPACGIFSHVKQGVLLGALNDFNKIDTLFPIQIVSGLDGDQYVFEVHHLPDNGYICFKSSISLDEYRIPHDIPDCLFECERYLNKLFPGWGEEFQYCLLHFILQHLIWNNERDDWGECSDYMTALYTKTKRLKEMKVAV